MTVRDLLPTLREKVRVAHPLVAERMHQGHSDGIEAKGQQGKDGVLDIEAQMGLKKDENVPKSEFMTVYFDKIAVVKQGIAEVETATKDIAKLKKNILKATQPQQEKEASEALKQLLLVTNRRVMAVKKALEAMKAENTDFAAKNVGNSEVRIRENSHAVLTRKFREVLMFYQALQTSYKHDVKEKVTRQVAIVHPDATDEEIAKMVDEGDPAQTADMIRMRITGGHESMQNALSDIQDKYNDIHRLEQSVTELHQMFVDLATLVESQGELLDQIEFSVNSAKDYTEKAQEDLVIAQKHQQTAKKRAMWISICIVILVVIITVPVMVMLKP